jgi:hypothetical protein
MRLQHISENYELHITAKAVNSGKKGNAIPITAMEAHRVERC